MMIITNTKYQSHFLTKENESVVATINGVTMYVPMNPDNRHYAEILLQVAAGTLTIAAAS
jgi:hypothetical protein